MFLTDRTKALKKLSFFVKATAFNGSEDFKIPSLNDLYEDAIFRKADLCREIDNREVRVFEPTGFFVNVCFNQKTQSDNNDKMVNPPQRIKEQRNKRGNRTDSRKQNATANPSPCRRRTKEKEVINGNCQQISAAGNGNLCQPAMDAKRNAQQSQQNLLIKQLQGHQAQQELRCLLEQANRQTQRKDSQHYQLKKLLEGRQHQQLQHLQQHKQQLETKQKQDDKLSDKSGPISKENGSMRPEANKTLSSDSGKGQSMYNTETDPSNTKIKMSNTSEAVIVNNISFPSRTVTSKESSVSTAAKTLSKASMIIVKPINGPLLIPVTSKAKLLSHANLLVQDSATSSVKKVTGISDITSKQLKMAKLITEEASESPNTPKVSSLSGSNGTQKISLAAEHNGDKEDIIQNHKAGPK